MGRFGKDDDMQTHSIGGSTFQFSAKKIAELGATEYTLGVIAVDVSSSLDGFGDELDKLIGTIVDACRKNPRADNMMLRVITFNTQTQEVHGFRPLPDLNPSDYAGTCDPYGMTALRDAAFSAIKSCTEYGEQLSAEDYDVNAAVFVITDGMDNRSKATVTMIKDALADARKSESLESIMPVLIGIGDGSDEDEKNLSTYLNEIKDEAGFQQYVYAGTCSPSTLAKVAGFVSKSVSSQSQALGTGGVSQSLSF